MPHPPLPPCPCHAPTLIDRLLPRARRVLLLGQPGTGKTTLARSLAAELATRGRPAWCLGADPGSPAFGVPGAVCLGHWEAGDWQLRRLEALCTLDAARFRLPLAAAVQQLVTDIPAGATLLLDAPGVVRGVAGAELMEALVKASTIDLVLVLQREGRPPPLQAELKSLEMEVFPVLTADQARRPGKPQRARRRTTLWDAWLSGSVEHGITFAGLHCLGTPPRESPEAWRGKLVAFQEQGRTCAMGEVVALGETTLTVRLPAGQRPTDKLVVRDAQRGGDGLVNTVKPFAADLVRYIPPPDLLPDTAVTPSGVRPVVQLGTATAALVNGVFGDPLLHLRLRHRRRSLLLDLGEGSRLPARLAHQVSDVFISHAHADHISGFLWLLRSRIGERGPCRLYGPPGLAGQVHGFLTSFHWDRIGERGPVFEVTEVQGSTLHRFRLQAGIPTTERLGNRAMTDSVLLEEPGFRIRCALLDHGIPVLAFAYEPAMRIKVRKERLDARRLPPGPWLSELKQHILKGKPGAQVNLPDGSRETVAALARDLTLTTAGERLVYATDFADTDANRRTLENLAAGAHTLMCEASFLEQDREQARRTGHLTTRACGEIARAAGVRHLVPFHFSRRYEQEPWRPYEEIAAVCAQTVVPRLAAGDVEL